MLGVSSLVFLIFISLSGLILNHADGLGLSRLAAGPWLQRLYGIEPPPVDSAYEAGGVVFATSSDTLFADGEELAKNVGRMIGAAVYDSEIVVATEFELFIVSPDGRLIERMDSDSELLQRSGVIGSQPMALSPAQAEQIGRAALGQAINLERVLLDFHSGRILPTVGRYVADLTALALLYMSFTGIWLWARRKNGNGNGKKK